MKENNTSSTYQKTDNNIVFAELYQFSRFIEVNKEKAITLLDYFNGEVIRLITENNGELIKNYGSSILCSFKKSEQAIQFSISLKLKLNEWGYKMIRIGIHSGEAYRTSNDIFGTSVNISSRIQSIAQANQILCSKAVKMRLSNQDIQLQSKGVHKLKHVSTEIEIYKVKRKQALSTPFILKSINISSLTMAILQVV